MTKFHNIWPGALLFCTCLTGYSQDQGFFLNEWSPAVISTPPYINTEQTTEPVKVSLKVLFHDTLTRVPDYLFGDNANLWTGCMSNNTLLMKHIRDRRMGILRGPAGSVSDEFFWNRVTDDRPGDIPDTLAGRTVPFQPWYGIRPNSWENWTMHIDSFYRILDHASVTGMLTVNYGYARYGTGPAPVANAAHMAADWVRYDNGRTKFWEIGNEVFGNWEAGYRIDPELNQDGQPEYINGTLYGQHCRVFIDSMKMAAAELGLDIRIGVGMLDAYSWENSTWNRDVAASVGDMADFYIVHSYYTPWNQNAGIATILNSYRRTGKFKEYIYAEVDKAGMPHLPVALTEYNIFAIGSSQPVSHANGMHAVLVTGEAMKTGYGAALRWDLANGWDNGNDHGMYSYGNEPGVAQYAPRPAFYHLYYQRRFTGDVMLNMTQRGDTNVVVYPTAFSSGQVAVTMVNKATYDVVVRLNIQDFKFGDRYYTYTLTGNGNDFSRKVFVNDIGNNGVAGGPSNYESIEATSSLIGEEIKIKLPRYSTTFILVEPGNKELVINEDIAGIPAVLPSDPIVISPNPTYDRFRISKVPDNINKLTISDMGGRILYVYLCRRGGELDREYSIRLTPGPYQCIFTGNDATFTKKLMIY